MFLLPTTDKGSFVSDTIDKTGCYLPGFHSSRINSCRYWYHWLALSTCCSSMTVRYISCAVNVLIAPIHFIFVDISRFFGKFFDTRNRIALINSFITLISYVYYFTNKYVKRKLIFKKVGMWEGNVSFNSCTS